ncbi:unnamed protein product [Prunus armeniaca]
MAKHPRMIEYLDKVQELLKAFFTFTIQQVPQQRTHIQRHWQGWDQHWTGVEVLYFCRAS